MHKAIFFVLGVSMCPVANAQSPGAAGALNGPAGRSVAINFENDTFGGTDEGYTNGARISYTERADEPTAWAHTIDRTLFRGMSTCFKKAAGCYHTQWSWSLVQTMYTPTDLANPFLQVNDRPYGGWLFLGSTATLTEHLRQQTFELDTGVIGPHSYSEQTQKYVHTHIAKHAVYPRGWKYQLKDQVGASFRYEFQQAIDLLRDANGRRVFDIVPSAGGVLGNVMLYANAGATVRLGSDLDEFVAGTIAPTRVVGSSGIKAYIFYATEGRWTPYNIFLSGNSTATRHHLDVSHFVSDNRIGVVAKLKILRISYTFVTRSPEIKLRQQHRYGVIAIGIGM